MGLYEIYIPELDTIVKFKILSLEEGQIFCLDHEGENSDEFKKAVLENVVYNLRTDVAAELKKRPKEDGEPLLDVLYNACIALNPGMNFAAWLRMARKDASAPAKSSTPQKEARKPGARKSTAIAAGPRGVSKAKFLNLDRHLKEKVIGQDEAIDQIVSALKRAHTGLQDPHRPLGVFFFAGASGVGKTLLARELHNYLYDGKYDLVRIDCGEYQQKHENQKLIGAPPGYIGHDEGGQLTNQVLNNPDTIVLIDEIEKAHPDMINTFLRIFDEGMVTDGMGKRVSFSRAVIIMTTNLGNDKIVREMVGRKPGFGSKLYTPLEEAELPPRSAIVQGTEQEIREHFKPELLNRIDKIVVFNNPTRDDYRKIAELELQKVQEKLVSRGFSVAYDNDVLEVMLDMGVNPVEGARKLSKVRRNQIEDLLADLLMTRSFPRGTTFQILPDDYGLKIVAQVARRKRSVPVEKEAVNGDLG